MGQIDRGLYEKYRVSRTDGKDKEGEKHSGCFYFVLDVTHDPFALIALEAYAKACRQEYPLLADDLLDLIKIKKYKIRREQEESRE